MFEAKFKQLLQRPADSHKYDYGHVLVVGGSSGMTGAPLLAGKAALRSGAGLVTIATPANIIDVLAGKVPELMTVASDSPKRLLQFIEDRKVSVAVIGPGLGSSAETLKLVELLLELENISLVIDGGALGALRSHLNLLQESHDKTIVLTPHLGEFQKLVEQRLPERREELKPIAEQFARQQGVSLVLKGNPTYVAQASGTTMYENETGNSGMATAGSGDVLSGMIGAFLAQGVGVEPAVYLHGLAGDLAAAAKTEPGMIASDIIESIPLALRQIAKPLRAGL